MRSNLGILLAGVLVVGLSAPVYAAVGSEEDAAVPPGSFVSTMAIPGAVAVKPDQAAAISAQPVKAVRLARAVAK
ncbi:MAG TPA: hypothetical protein VH019_08410 [Rhizomicrobium sp.]|jgi:hypothetical protein|nr:hypothetical protein [Rhizomicrobium sp.]